MHTMGWWVGKIIMILSFRVDISENPYIDHQGKETCVMSGLTIQNKNDAIFVTFLV